MALLGFSCVSCCAAGPLAKADARWDARFASPRPGPLVFHGQKLIRGGETVSQWDGSDWVLLGKPDNFVNHVVSTSAGLYVAGEFTKINNTSARKVALWNGRQWKGLSSSKQPSPTEWIFSVARYTNDTILVVEYKGPDTPYSTVLWLWNGKRWQHFGEQIRVGNKCKIEQIVANGKGDVYARVYSELPNDWGTKVCQWDGKKWRELPRQPARHGTHVIAVTESGQLFAGGEFYDRRELKGIARWNGQDWVGLGEGLDGYALSLAFHKGDLLVGGCFGRAGQAKSRSLAKWDGHQWSGFGEGMSGGGALAWDGPNGGGTSDMTSVRHIAAREDVVFVSGGFTRAGNVGASGVAHWNGREWVSMANLRHQGVSGKIKALSVMGTNIFAAGDFRAAGGIACPGLACWNGQRWTDVPGVPQAHDFSAMATDGTRLVAVGTIVGAQLFSWNGHEWSAIKPCPYFISALAVRGTEIFAGWARFANNEWTSLLAEFWGRNTSIDAIAIDKNDVYAGGSRYGRLATPNIGRWDGKRWHPLGEGVIGLYLGAGVKSIAIRGRNIYAGGDFQAAGEVEANGIACWDGHEWKALGEGVTGEGPYDGKYFSVNAMVFDGTKLYVGGQFSQAGNVPANNVAVWDGKRWLPLGSGVDGRVHALTIQGRSLYVGGEFKSAGGKPSANFARWELE